MGPLVALTMIYLLKIDGIVAQSLFIASSFPTSRNTATIAMAQSLFIASSFPTSRNTSTIAMEYQIEPELHAQIVLFSTLLALLQ